jgi:hypothetical protein
MQDMTKEDLKVLRIDVWIQLRNSYKKLIMEEL